jgi:hypothetical protein
LFNPGLILNVIIKTVCKIAYRRGDILYLAIFGDMQSCGDASPNPSVGTKYKGKALKEQSLRAFKLVLLPATPEMPVSHHPVQTPCRLTLSQGSLSRVL